MWRVCGQSRVWETLWESEPLSVWGPEWMCTVDMSGCGHVKDPSLRPMAVFPSGPCVAVKRMCAENVHHSFLPWMFLAWRLLTCRDFLLRWAKPASCSALYAYPVSLSVCNNSSSLSSCLQQFKHLTHTLSFRDAAASPSENPVHPIPAFLCVCLSSFTLLVWPKSLDPCKGWGKTQSQKLNSSGVNLQCCNSVSSTLTSKVLLR